MSRTFCCTRMAADLTYECPEGRDRWETTDTWFCQTTDGGIGLTIKDGGMAYSVINFCPFCGADVSVPSGPNALRAND